MKGHRIVKDKSEKTAYNKRIYELRREKESLEKEVLETKNKVKALLYEAKGNKLRVENRRAGVMAALNDAGLGGSVFGGQDVLTEEEKKQLLDEIDRDLI